MINKRINQKQTCQQCGKDFFPFRASKGIFCSNKCKFIAKEINRIYPCLFCGKSFKPKYKSTKYCSNPCYQQYKIKRPIRERLYSRIKKTDYCWLWTGSRNKLGYGRVFYDGKMQMAHRLVFELETGEDISDKIIRHFVCDNPPCVNPAHLRSGQKVDNSADMVNHKRHAHGETSYAKVTEKDVLKIRADNRKQHIIAVEYGISRRAVGHIKTRSTWKHI